jgi:hypothetical protein
MGKVLELEPELCRTGFYHYDGPFNYWDGSGEHKVGSPADYEAFFQQERERLLQERELHQFLLARQWLRGFGKATYPKASSYTLKHACEWDMCNALEGQPYMTNGAFIAAAIAEKFQIRRRRNSPNALINISLTDRGVGFDGALLKDIGIVCDGCG